MKIRFLIAILVTVWTGSVAYGGGQAEPLRHQPAFGRVFYFTAKRFGIPVLKASLGIQNGSSQEGRPLTRVHACLDSPPSLALFFRMNNRFTSLMDSETCTPMQYVKVIDQEGLVLQKKNYLQTLTFDVRNKKVVVEQTAHQKREEILLPPETYDPLSMIARCYLREELQPGREVRMSIYDGIKFRQIAFQPRKEKVQSRLLGEVEAVRLESNMTFSTLGDKEGILRIWYAADGEKVPVRMELDLPIGDVIFELESMEKG